MSAPGADARMAHHFDTPEQQYESAKLGMWLFLATELLMFGGLFCAYSIFRSLHPEIFTWGHKLLDANLGAANTVILIFSSLTMAWAVRSAQLGRRLALMVTLALTLLCACGFMGIKYVEYRSKWTHGLLWGGAFRPDPEYIAHRFSLHAPVEGVAVEQRHVESAAEGDAAALTRGKELFLSACAACHGQSGEGLPKLGKSIQMSRFVRDHNDEKLLDFVGTGRLPTDSLNTTGIAMPARGSMAELSEDELRDIVAYLREIQMQAPHPLSGSADPRHAGASLTPPPGAHIYFGIYFAMTGLHGLHVLVGMGMLAWLLRKASQGVFGPSYFTPVEIGGLYWHLVDLIWIFLFPLLYLIS